MNKTESGGYNRYTLFYMYFRGQAYKSSQKTKIRRMKYVWFKDQMSNLQIIARELLINVRR